MYCKHCGANIDSDCVVCPKCGKQVAELKGGSGGTPNIIINNTNRNTNTVSGGRYGRAKNKWVSFTLCLLLGYLGAHKFYEGKTGMGFLYLFTLGLCGIGWVIDIFVILAKPNPYYV